MYKYLDKELRFQNQNDIPDNTSQESLITKYLLSTCFIPKLFKLVKKQLKFIYSNQKLEPI